ncbi:arylamine N-acetyltransferase family protein [Streptomyces morookaense]|uniref:arylamine N-acetyltransferase family protein n=1 Tax=Streptomyces morookaense TaxID=1970 RepID=UPI003F4CE8EE
MHLGEEIVLEGEALVEKVVQAGRGGFCYELNGAFAHLLTALGYRVSLLAARMVMPDGSLGIPYDHLALRVETGQGGAAGAPRSWLVDVGAGAHSLYPLDYRERGEQSDPAGVFRIAEADGGEGDDLEVFRDGTLQYRLEQRPRDLADFEPGCWWHRTSPKSPFTRSLVCSRPTGAGTDRVTLSGRKLVITDASGKLERTLAEDEVLGAYRKHFGIALDRVPEEPGAL